MPHLSMRNLRRSFSHISSRSFLACSLSSITAYLARPWEEKLSCRIFHSFVKVSSYSAVMNGSSPPESAASASPCFASGICDLPSGTKKRLR